MSRWDVLSNHIHVIMRSRPDIVKAWSDEEVACRWKLAWPQWNDREWSREPTDEEIRELLEGPVRLARAREGLASLEGFYREDWGEHELSLAQVQTLLADSWLAPICSDGPPMTDVARIFAEDRTAAS